jgi:hypothetical protein
VKSIDEDIKTTLIGLHPSTKPLDSLAHPNIDFVIIGEPEETAFELTKRYLKKKALILKHLAESKG